MMTIRHRASTTRHIVTDQSGQAMLEFAVIASLLIVLVFAIIDFGRAFNQMQVMVGLTRQGSNLASRGTSLTDSAKAVVNGDAPLDLNSNGEVIVTSVTNNASGNIITGQVTQGAMSQASKVGQGVGTAASLPATAIAMLQPGQTIYITEVFYNFQPITPISTLLNIVMPPTFYQAAYF
jgi:Flp pilus assembly protein TadG